MPSCAPASSTRLRLVRPPRDYSRIGEMIVRMAELTATYHAAQAVRGCTPAPAAAGPSLKLVHPEPAHIAAVQS